MNENESNKKIIDRAESYGTYDSIRFLIDRTLEYITDANKEINLLNEVPFGIPDLAVHKGDLIFLISRPGNDLSSLVCSVIRKLGIDEKRPVGLITTGPMDYSIIGKKIFCMESHVPYGRIASKFMRSVDIEKVLNVTEQIFNSPIFMLDAPNGNFEKIKCAISHMVKEQKVEMVFIDSYEYLDEIANPEKYEKLYQKEELLNKFKDLAIELRIPIVFTMEISESENGPELGIKDLRKDMIISRVADVIIFFHWDKAKEEWIECEDIPSTLIVAKNEENSGPGNYLYKIMFRQNTKEFII